ncbi:hypothetical protein CERZMDRAFT_89138 [Cercospora zeae-maydis SCOH1-5]|uniref:Uncharacterized protein n=1 Tax=Cercospora zeae-maydis SCOH1-5 TaxID=717836 RepID=A0A6A6EZX4_9PEZI|nr:hypothetical protein CERZMDRAFT_89138 [Cercospora zeae-maydis SCOH1-5]
MAEADARSHQMSIIIIISRHKIKIKIKKIRGCCSACSVRPWARKPVWPWPVCSLGSPLPAEMSRTSEIVYSSSSSRIQYSSTVEREGISTQTADSCASLVPFSSTVQEQSVPLSWSPDHQNYYSGQRNSHWGTLSIITSGDSLAVDHPLVTSHVVGGPETGSATRCAAFKRRPRRLSDSSALYFFGGGGGGGGTCGLLALLGWPRKRCPAEMLAAWSPVC